MSKAKFNTFSFNNFKPFGEKVQTFTKKPITLIYGPNSTGKSSLLHSMLNHEYIIEIQSENFPDNSDLALVKNNFFGDELDLGGFNHYIHGHNRDAHLNYSSNINREEDIANILSPNYLKIKEFKDNGVFDMIDQLLGDDTEVVKYETILKLDGLRIYRQKENTYYFPNIHKLHYKSTINMEEGKKIKDAFIANNKFQKNENIDAIFEKLLGSNELLSDIAYKDDGTDLDELDRFILFLLDNSYVIDKYFSFKEDALECDFLKFYTRYLNKEISLCKYLSNISSLKIDREIFYSKEAQGFLNTNKFYIDNELLFTVVKKERKIYFKIKKNHPFIKNVCSKKKNIQKLFVANGIGGDIRRLDNFDIFIHHRYLIGENKTNNTEVVKDNLKDIISYLSNKAFYSGVHLESQYIGPLRWVPGRNDLIQRSDYKIAINKNFDKDDLFREWESQYTSNIKKLPDSIRKFEILIKTYIIFFMVFHFIKIWPKFISSANKSPGLADYFNVRKKNKDKVSGGNTKTTERMWEELIASQTIRDKLNNWLGDDTKLKSTYKIIANEYKKKNSFIKRLFGKKEHLVKVLSFVDIKSNTEVLIKDMGLGISQVIPVLISCFTQKKTKIFLEQPELHLHPAIQSELADEFIRSYKENNNEFIIETHSEHLLLRVMKRMRHTAEGRIDKDDVLALTPDDVCLLYIDNDQENTFINELELDKDGILLDIWPNGFFEEGYNERFD